MAIPQARLRQNRIHNTTRQRLSLYQLGQLDQFLASSEMNYTVPLTISFIVWLKWHRYIAFGNGRVEIWNIHIPRRIIDTDWNYYTTPSNYL